MCEFGDAKIITAEPNFSNANAVGNSHIRTFAN